MLPNYNILYIIYIIISSPPLTSVSPERWLAITPQPAALDMRTASMDSVTVPIWFTCRLDQIKELVHSICCMASKHTITVTIRLI